MRSQTPLSNTPQNDEIQSTMKINVDSQYNYLEKFSNKIPRNDEIQVFQHEISDS